VCVFFNISLFHVTKDSRSKQISSSVIENIADPFLSQKSLVDDFIRLDSISLCRCYCLIISIYRHSVKVVYQFRCGDVILCCYVELACCAVWAVDLQLYCSWNCGYEPIEEGGIWSFVFLCVVQLCGLYDVLVTRSVNSYRFSVCV